MTTLITAATTCHGCLISQRQWRSACTWCGAAIRQGRVANDRERYETSRVAVDDRHAAIEDARRTSGHVDGVVLDAIRLRLAPLAEFTYDELVPDTGLNPCALKYALLRLQERGIVRLVRYIKVRSNRARPVWQVLLPRQQADASPLDAPTPHAPAAPLQHAS